MKNWLVKAYSNHDKKHCFSRVIISADSRTMAREKALNFTSEERRIRAWQGGAGHCITVMPYPLNYGHY